MDARVERQELVNRVAQRLNLDSSHVAEIVSATLEEIYEALKHGESVSLRDFGTFFVRQGRDTWVFKFNPSQRVREVFGWSSTYKGEL